VDVPDAAPAAQSVVPDAAPAAGNDASRCGPMQAIPIRSGDREHANGIRAPGDECGSAERAGIDCEKIRHAEIRDAEIRRAVCEIGLTEPQLGAMWKLFKKTSDIPILLFVGVAFSHRLTTHQMRAVWKLARRIVRAARTRPPTPPPLHPPPPAPTPGPPLQSDEGAPMLSPDEHRVAPPTGTTGRDVAGEQAHPWHEFKSSVAGIGLTSAQAKALYAHHKTMNGALGARWRNFERATSRIGLNADQTNAVWKKTAYLSSLRLPGGPRPILIPISSDSENDVVFM